QIEDLHVQISHSLPNLGAAQESEEQASNKVRVARRLGRHAHSERADKLDQGLAGLPRFLDRKAERRELHFGKGQEDVVLAWEVVEERTFADVGGVRDVFHRGFRKASLGEKVQGGTEETFAKLQAAAFTPVGGVGTRESSHNDLYS